MYLFDFYQVRITGYDCNNYLNQMTSKKRSDLHKKVTMRDVAQAVGVSQSTLSRILNPSPSTSNVPISD